MARTRHGDMILKGQQSRVYASKKMKQGLCVIQGHLAKFKLPPKSLAAVNARLVSEAPQISKVQLTGCPTNIKDDTQEKEKDVEELEKAVALQKTQIESQGQRIRELENFQRKLTNNIERLEIRTKGLIQMQIRHEGSMQDCKLKEKRLEEEKAKLEISIIGKDAEILRLKKHIKDLRATGSNLG